MNLDDVLEKARRFDVSFEESKHPRGEGGKFSTKAGEAPNYHVLETEPFTSPGGVPTPKGYKLAGKGNLAAQGFKPKKRTGRGPTMTEAMQVAWGAAKASGKPETLAATGYGWALLKAGDKIAHGQPHIVVTPGGDVHSFKADI